MLLARFGRDAYFLLPFDWMKPLLVVLPLSMLFILVSEVRSKVALDSWLVAKYPVGHRMYSRMVIWHGVAFILLTVWTAILILSIP